ncbi:MAG: phosphatase PAP2 family protein, partial [Saprospiraceae bacterium]
AIPVSGGGLLALGTSFVLSNQVSPLTVSGIDHLLATHHIPTWDRYATRYYDRWPHQVSNGLGLASILLPATFMLDKANRQHAAELGYIVFEGALVTGGLTNLTKMLALRPRPYVFNPNAPLSIKLEKEARYSYFSGHTSLTAYFSFATAQIYNDLYPQSRYKKVVWASAVALPLVAGYMRMRAGKHYLSDVVSGYVVGAATGILIPRLHKRRG